MNPLKFAILFIVLASLGAAGGAGLAVLIAQIEPTFYRTTAAGISIGLGQGAAAGACGAVAWLALSLWHQRRLLHPDARVTIVGRVVGYTFIAIVSVICICLVLLVYLRTTHNQSQYIRAKHESSELWEAVVADPQFDIIDYSIIFENGYISVTGRDVDLQTYHDFRQLIEEQALTVPVVLDLELEERSDGIQD
jgi:hypothetical protein